LHFKLKSFQYNIGRIFFGRFLYGYFGNKFFHKKDIHYKIRIFLICGFTIIEEKNRIGKNIPGTERIFVN